jgi:hypothetical protein
VGWDEEKALERYELLREAGIVGPEAEDSGRASAAGRRVPRLAHPMLSDQAQVLARALGELRRALKYRPVIFELMPDEFTLFEAAATVEAIPNPTAQAEFPPPGGGLPAGGADRRVRLRTGGRPARLTLPPRCHLRAVGSRRTRQARPGIAADPKAARWP